jgi:hypothetical protein
MRNKRSFVGWIVLLFCMMIVSPSLGQDSLVSIAKRIGPSVVAVMTYDSLMRPLRQGTGFFATPDGDVVTKRDLLEGVYRAEIRPEDNMPYPILRVLAEDREADLIRVAVEIPKRLVHPLAVSRSFPQVGERILAINPPSTSEKRFSYGIVSGLREAPGFGKMIQVVLYEPTLTSSTEGRPVVNLEGGVIGVVLGKKLERKTLYFVLPGDRLMDILPGGAVPKLLPGKGKALSEWEAGRREAAEKLYAEGLPYYWKGDYERALPYFKEAVKKNPRDSMAHFQIGYCYAELGRYAEALEAYQRAIQIKPDFVLAHFYRGLLYLEEGDKNHAMEEYRILRNLDQNYASDLLHMIG